MVAQNGNKKLRGFVIEKEGRYVFRTTKGEIYGLVQDKQAEKLARTKEICIMESVPQKNPNDKFGKITKVIGKGGDIIPEGKAIADSYGLNNNIPADVKFAVDGIPSYVRVSDKKNFADRCDIPFVTIDPDTAKDYDDAVYARANDDGSFTLMVAIANVAKYVEPNSPLFNHAMEKGNSSYLGNTVYPMLPEKLSNGICSLNEGVERLTMLTKCRIGKDGKLLDYSVEPAVIKSRHRLTYKEADYIHFGKNAVGDNADHKGLHTKTLDVKDSINTLFDVAEVLNKARMKRGALDIEDNEYSYTYSADGMSVIDFAKSHNEVSTGVIEETAILANEIWGEISLKLGVPFIFRDHQLIDDKNVIRNAQNELRQFNIKLPTTPISQNLQKIINDVKGKKIYDYVVKSLLGIMKPATYMSIRDEYNGHMGLAIKRPVSSREKIDTDAMIEDARKKYFSVNGSPYGLYFEGDISHTAYGHTTSPIRRGSDTANQQQMMSIIMDGRVLYTESKLNDLTGNLNFSERNSKLAEIEYNEMLFAQYAKNHIGEKLEHCYVIGFGEKEALIKAPNGLQLRMPFKAFDCPRQYIKIGKELKSITICDVSLYPPKISAVPSVNYAQWSQGRKNSMEQGRKNSMETN